MKFTDLFVRRPVLALVVSTLLLLMGLRALSGLPIRQYPLTESTTITITTPVSYTHLTLPTNSVWCRSRWSPYH